MVLVVRHCGLGDLLTGLPAMRAIRRHFAGHRLVTTCPSNLVGLAQRLKIADEFITEPHGQPDDPIEHVSTDDAMISRLLTLMTSPDLIIALRVPVREDLAAALVRTAPDRLIAYRHVEVKGTEAFPEFSFDDHILVRWERLLHPRGIETCRAELLAAPWTHPGQDTSLSQTVIHVGSASPSRRWPTKRWAAVAEALAMHGHTPVLTGSAAERALANDVLAMAGLDSSQNLCGTTDAVELAEIVQVARLVLSTDTGISHLATAFRRPSVTLFGAVSPDQWGPPPGHPLNLTLWKGRYGDAYADSVDSGLLKISVDDVLKAVMQLEACNPL